jgi:hypothetical protein
LDAGLTTLLCKQITVAKCEEVKTGCNLSNSPKEGYGSERAVLSMMMVMMMMIYYQSVAREYLRNMENVTNTNGGSTVSQYHLTYLHNKQAARLGALPPGGYSEEKNFRDFSPQGNYTDRATVARRQMLVSTLADRGGRVVSATDPHGP